MTRQSDSRLRKALVPLAATAVAIGALLGLPSLKALAAGQGVKILPPRAIEPPAARLAIVQPPRINPNARTLVSIADQALTDSAFAERMFNDPDAVAAQYNLSDHEKLVLRNMTREQFDVARTDAAAVSADRLAKAGGRPLPARFTDTRLIAEGMVVGRAILAAVGRSYLDAANTHGCCPWGHAIELGVNPSRVFYNEVFEAPAVNLRQPGLEVMQPIPRT